MGTLERALALAAASQRDKANQPYILHPIRIMLAVETDDERMAALLHDVVEDTPVTFEMLRALGFSDVPFIRSRSFTARGNDENPARRYCNGAGVMLYASVLINFLLSASGFHP